LCFMELPTCPPIRPDLLCRDDRARDETLLTSAPSFLLHGTPIRMGLLVTATFVRLGLRLLPPIRNPPPEAGNESPRRTSPVDVETDEEYQSQHESQTEEEPFCEV
jgi:hypothetical protein